MSSNQELLTLVRSLNQKIDQLTERVENTPTPAAAQPVPTSSVDVGTLEEFFPIDIRDFEGEIPSSKVTKDLDKAGYEVRRKFNKLLKDLLKNFLPEYFFPFLLTLIYILFLTYLLYYRFTGKYDRMFEGRLTAFKNLALEAFSVYAPKVANLTSDRLLKEFKTSIETSKNSIRVVAKNKMAREVAKDLKAEAEAAAKVVENDDEEEEDDDDEEEEDDDDDDEYDTEILSHKRSSRSSLPQAGKKRHLSVSSTSRSTPSTCTSSAKKVVR